MREQITDKLDELNDQMGDLKNIIKNGLSS